MIAYLEVRVFQCLGGGDALVGVDGEHLRDEVLRFCADVEPVLVVEAVDSLLDLRKQSCLQHTRYKAQGATHRVVQVSASESQCNRESAILSVKGTSTRVDYGLYLEKG